MHCIAWVELGAALGRAGCSASRCERHRRYQGERIYDTQRIQKAMDAGTEAGRAVVGIAFDCCRVPRQSVARDITAFTGHWQDELAVGRYSRPD